MSGRGLCPSKIQINYLINLSNRNAVILHDLKDTVAISPQNKNRIGTKYRNHMSDLSDRNWQEWHYEMIQNDDKFNNNDH